MSAFFRSIITPSIKPPCSQCPRQCHHQPLWLWMSVKPLIYYVSQLFQLWMAVLPLKPDSVQQRVYENIKDEALPVLNDSIALSVLHASIALSVLKDSIVCLMTGCDWPDLKYIKVQTVLHSICMASVYRLCFRMQNCHLVVFELCCSCKILHWGSFCQYRIWALKQSVRAPGVSGESFYMVK